jgi:CRP-like cAMP-binding protein
MFRTVSPHDRLVGAISRYAVLNDTDRACILALAIETKDIAPTKYLVREGQRPERCALILEGFSFRQKLTTGGQRAIVALQVPGDFTDLQNLYLNDSDHDVLALTSLRVAVIAIEDLQRLSVTRPAINKALWICGLVESSTFREWLLNIGRRDARGRVGHLLCEISARLEAAGLARELTYELPMTQEQLGDALGLTAVHINRVLKALEKDGLIQRRKRQITIADWRQLRHAADFNDRYLHVQQSAA